MFDFVWFFSRIGWRWPVCDTDSLEVWSGVTLVSELPGWLVRAEVTHVLSGVALQGALADRVARQALRRPPARLLPAPAHRAQSGYNVPTAPSPRLLGVQGRRLRGYRKV